MLDEKAIATFDPRQPNFRADPYPTYHALRRQDPIHYRQAHDDWLLTGYANIVAVLKDANFGHAEWQTPPSTEKTGSLDSHPILWFRRDSQRLMRLWVILQNPPNHTRLRKAMHRPFTPRLISRLRIQIEQVANRLIDQVATKGELDLIADFAHPLPTAIIAGMLGIPDADYAYCQQLSNHLAVLLDLDVAPLSSERGYLAFSGFTQYFRRLLTQRALPTATEENLLAILVEAHKQGQLSEDELLAHCTLLFFAGHSTTQHLIGNGMLALLRHPQQWQLLRMTPSLRPLAIQECLRYDTSAQLVSRTASADIHFGGKLIRKGQIVHLLLGAANRDPAQFPNPDVFDIQRHPNLPLSFGYGIHYCFGAPLAQLIAEIAIGVLARRLPNLVLQTSKLEWEDTVTVRGLKRLPVCFTVTEQSNFLQ